MKDLKAYLEWAAVDDGFDPAIKANILWQGQYNTRRLKLGDLYRYINLEWAYLFRSKEMEQLFSKIARIRPHILVINSASNDLCELTKRGWSLEKMKREAETLAYEMRDRARELRDYDGIGNITFITAIKRGKGFGGSKAHFEEVMKAFNYKLIELICQEPRMRVHKVCGFTAEEPEVWAKDKLHPTREWDSPVFNRYLREVRAALSHAVAAVKDDDRYYGE